MLSWIRNYLAAKRHHPHRITDVVLYRNREKKSVFIVLALSGSLLITNLEMHFYYNGLLGGTAAVLLSNFYIAVLLVLSIFILPYHPENYGFNIFRLKKNLGYGSLFGLIGLALSVSARFALVSAGKPEYAFYPVCDALFIQRLIIYPVSAFIQEAVGKGLFQSYFVGAFKKLKWNRFWAILIASLIFGQFHLLYGIPAAVVLFCFSMITGVIYEKLGRSLVGVSLIHLLAGAGFLFFSKAF